MVDYGYWYVADGRDSSQQDAFFAAEVKPQALEWLFSVACGYPFAVSVDNVAIETTESDWYYWEKLAQDKASFQMQCREQILQWLATSIPKRAQSFVDALLAVYRPGHQVKAEEFSIESTMSC